MSRKQTFFQILNLSQEILGTLEEAGVDVYRLAGLSGRRARFTSLITELIIAEIISGNMTHDQVLKMVGIALNSAEKLIPSTLPTPGKPPSSKRLSSQPSGRG